MGMRKTQYYDFIRYALGIKYYLQNDGYEVRNKANSKDRKASRIDVKKSSSKARVLAYLYKLGKKQNTFFVKEYDYEEKCFRDESDTIYNARVFFDDVDDSLIWSVLMGVLGVESFLSENHHKNTEIGKIMFESIRPSQYRFILGAGVNSGYGLGNWNCLIDSIRDEIRALKGIPHGTKPDILLKFETDMSNTNYIAPQILKDLDSVIYYDTIYKSLYGSFNPNIVNQTLNPTIEDTTLFQIARILAKDENSVALTFNYDDVLEQVLNCNFSTPYYSDYYQSSKSKGIQIIHSHGFYPYGSSGVKHARSIVFSCFEYMDGYLSSKTYARRRLYEQIQQPCLLVGNSLSDYEEQKVFFLHHKNRLSHFSYLFTTRNNADNYWMDIYRSIYYLKMGVIPVFFDDFPQMIDYLKKL